MKKRSRKTRRRLEFAALDARIDPGFQLKAWRQFYEAVVHDVLPTNSFTEQYRIVERTRRAHARRDRYNAKRQQKKLRAIQRLFDPEIACYIALDRGTDIGLFGMSAGSPSNRHFEALRGIAGTDIRLTKKLLRECEVIRQFMNPPACPWEVDGIQLAPGEKRQMPSRDEAFLGALAATSVPDDPEVLFFEPVAELSDEANESTLHPSSRTA